MSIWKIIKDNFLKGSRTRKPEEKVPCPQAFRGQLVHHVERCTACGTCAYVCSPSAIEVEYDEVEGALWHYNAAQCTYCGRCAAYCPTQAIQLEAKVNQIGKELFSYHVDHQMELVACTRCGKKFIPLPPNTLIKLYGDPLPPEIAATRGMCEECRNRLATKSLKDAIRGPLARRASDLIDHQQNIYKEDL